MHIRRLVAVLSFTFFFLMSHSALAMLSLELTRGVSGATPIAIIPFELQGQTPSQDVSAVISNDLRNSGRFKVTSSASDSVDNIVRGKVIDLGGDRYQVSFQLSDAFRGKTAPQQSIIMNQKFDVSGSELRSLSHHISDLIYQKITGTRGIFSTRLAYIVVQRGMNGRARYTLEAADQDGYNPRPLLTSTDPIMSPSWSPNGKQIAYVSFENKHAAIYVQDLSSGSRRLISEFPGINGAPAWSPDGRKLALVLSKSGSPNIYLLDLGSHQLSQLTRDYYINTEPAFSPNGGALIFTSTRSGNPQIYEMKLGSRAISRVTYDGNYNARPSYTPDGNHIVVLNRESGMYNIGIMDLDTGTFKVLTNSRSDHGSPSIAPNGSMVVFEAYDSGKNVLGMATTDGQIDLRLPARNGDVQDPAWSPFLS
jgi:TolB protein